MPLHEERPGGWEDILSAPERERAAAFTAEVGRVRYVRTRFALRRILGGLLGVEPAAVAIDLDPGGKPVLADGALEFNHAHTDGLALVAVARGTPVGIDVEREGRRSDFRAIAARFFASQERVFLEQEETEERFLQLWTRKEAVLKAAGTGLAGGMETFCVASRDGWHDGLVFEERGYVVRDIAVPEGYRAALAVLAAEREVR